MKAGLYLRYWKIKDVAMKKIKSGPGIAPPVSTSQKVAFLQQTDAYSFSASHVETKETHMSWVFLVNGLVYKLKKPVAYQYLDLRTQASRYINCRMELLLNRRLAPGIYLGVVPLTVDESGKMAIGGEGAEIDWLVQMKRIPEHYMLDYTIVHKIFINRRLKNTARLLAHFYQQAPPVCISPPLYRSRLQKDIEDVGNLLLDDQLQLPHEQITRVITGLQRFLATHQDLFNGRVDRGKIIEAHGDLRPEHICVGPRPAIIDCLEFNRQLRVLDTAEELSFLLLECETMGNKSIGQVFVDIYTSITGDRIPGALIHFYMAKRACLRAYLVARHVAEAVYKEDTRWLIKARLYLQLAEGYLALLHP